MTATVMVPTEHDPTGAMPTEHPVCAGTGKSVGKQMSGTYPMSLTQPVYAPLDPPRFTRTGAELSRPIADHERYSR